MLAIVPLRVDARTKSRLSAFLSEAERRSLALAMAEDVIGALKEARSMSSVLIVSPDDEAARLAASLGVNHVREHDRRGVNAAVQDAAGMVGKESVREILVINADVPLVTGAGIDALVGDFRAQCARYRHVVGLVSDRAGRGTNAVLLTLPTSFRFAFGPHSFAAHEDIAKRAGFSAVRVRSEPAEFDIDTGADLDDFAARAVHGPGGAATRRYLATLDPYRLPSAPEPLQLLGAIAAGHSPSRHDVDALKDVSLADLMRTAADMRDHHHGRVVSYSRKVFLPLTHLCRDVCHYCTFAVRPSRARAPYMTLEDALATARQAQALGCKEALFTLGDKPELRYAAARDALDDMGFASTLDYVAAVAKAVLEETGLLPHINAGCMDEDDIDKLRTVSASMGLMLENISPRLGDRGGPHFGSPDKDPEARLATIRRAGIARVPFTSGLLVGIGETREERLQSLFALRDLNDQFGHIQEIIIQNFVPKPGTRMSAAPAADRDEVLWTIAMARLIFGATMNIQAPPNLNEDDLGALIAAGINDWGGVSPLTPDYVNPEKPWPHIDRLAELTAASGKTLVERLTVYPTYARAGETWLDAAVRPAALKHCDGQHYARDDDWLTGVSDGLPASFPRLDRRTSQIGRVSPALRETLDRVLAGAARDLGEAEIAALFTARGPDFVAVARAADELRQAQCGDDVTFVINRNINYTNICTYRCQFCAFSKGKRRNGSGDAPYLLSLDTIKERTVEAWHRGATEVCLQGGIHPTFTGETYLSISRAIRSVIPDMHIHAFSPLEVWHGAQSLGLSLQDFLAELKGVGLNSLPGTAAEILDDEVRAVICPDKIATDQWLEVIETAHGLGIPTTATIMFGHVDRYQHWARHLMRIRDLQRRTGGFTEFVPLPFVAGEAPIFLKGRSRMGPTLREAVLMHSVARLVLGSDIANIQTSWVKMGRDGATLCLNAGANDLGGTLMNESITRAAGARHGQEVGPREMVALIDAMRRTPRQRTTLYRDAAAGLSVSA